MTAQPTTEAVWSDLGADLRRFIRRRVSDDHTADDLLQETFLRIHRSLGTLTGADRLAGWVYRIARNVVHDHYRRASAGTVARYVHHLPSSDVYRPAAWRLPVFSSLRRRGSRYAVPEPPRRPRWGHVGAGVVQ